MAATRRRLLLAALLAPLAGLARATTPAATLRRRGSGTYRRFGLAIYDATLWAGDDPQRPPLTLTLTYRRAIGGETISTASVREIRALGYADETTLARWGQWMTQLFPDVRAGDSISGHYLPTAARFDYNGQPLGSIEDAGFARAFFGIWLDPRTSAPELRAALLQETPAGSP